MFNFNKIIMTIMNKEFREIADLVNTIQNENNLFINLDIDDIETIYNYVVKHDLDHKQTVELLYELGYV